MKRRSFLFWICVGAISLHRTSLIGVQMILSKRRREKEEKQSTEQLVLLNSNEKEVQVVKKGEKGFDTLLFTLTLTEGMTRYAVYFFVFYLLSCEYSTIYCKGSTILSHYLSAFSNYLQRHEKYKLCEEVLNFSKLWNTLWLGEESKVLKRNYKQLAKINLLLNQPARALHFSNLVSSIDFDSKKAKITSTLSHLFKPWINS